MATFPAYVRYGPPGVEQAAPVVLRTDMDRGISKQRRTAADAIVQAALVLIFDKPSDAVAFETWVYTEIGGGADWFTWTNPRTGITTQARIVGGDIGRLEAMGIGWRQVSRRNVTLEYVRSAL